MEQIDISKIKAVVFDCDGVMFDTAEANRKFYDEVLGEFGKPRLTEEQFINVHMMTVTSAIGYLFPDMEDHTPVYERIKNIGYAKFIPHMKMEKGLVALLEGIKEAGMIRGVATNRTNTMDRVIMDYKLESSFDMVVTAADVEHPKPAPDQLVKIMAAYDLDPREVIFIGDSEYDQKAAQKAGTWFIAFKQERLRAHVHVNTMEDVLDLLQINK